MFSLFKNQRQNPSRMFIDSLYANQFESTPKIYVTLLNVQKLIRKNFIAQKIT